MVRLVTSTLYTNIVKSVIVKVRCSVEYVDIFHLSLYTKIM